MGGLGPALTSAVLSGLLLDFFFTEPFFSLRVDAQQNVVTLVAMILVAVRASSASSVGGTIRAGGHARWWADDGHLAAGGRVAGVGVTGATAVSGKRQNPASRRQGLVQHDDAVP